VTWEARPRVCDCEFCVATRRRVRAAQGLPPDEFGRQYTHIGVDWGNGPDKTAVLVTSKHRDGRAMDIVAWPITKIIEDNTIKDLEAIEDAMFFEVIREKGLVDGPEAGS